MTTTPRGRALGLAAAAAFAPLAYAAVRVVESRLSPEQDPAAVIWSERSAFQTRWMVVGYVTAVVLAGTLALAAAAPRAAPRIVAALAVVGALAAVVQTAWWP